jgi:hypothetical protein
MSWHNFQFPKDLLSWIELHHGLAGWVEALGVIGSLLLTQHIATREQRARRESLFSYKRLLIDAFKNLREPMSYLDELNWKAPAHNPAIAVQGSSEETARQMADAITRMQDAQVVVQALEDINRLDQFQAILAIFHLRREISEARPIFERELAWLKDHGNSEHVVGSAVATVGGLANILIILIDNVLAALKSPFEPPTLGSQVRSWLMTPWWDIQLRYRRFKPRSDLSSK